MVGIASIVSFTLRPVIYFIGLPYIICSLAVRPARHLVQIQPTQYTLDKEGKRDARQEYEILRISNDNGEVSSPTHRRQGK